jgi:hypothetical protein
MTLRFSPAATLCVRITGLAGASLGISPAGEAATFEAAVWPGGVTACPLSKAIPAAIINARKMFTISPQVLA